MESPASADFASAGMRLQGSTDEKVARTLGLIENRSQWRLVRQLPT